MPNHLQVWYISGDKEALGRVEQFDDFINNVNCDATAYNWPEFSNANDESKQLSALTTHSVPI